MEEDKKLLNAKTTELLQTADNDLLSAIFNGSVDIKLKIYQELRNRYLGPDGIWVGPQGLKEAWKNYQVVYVNEEAHLIRK